MLGTWSIAGRWFLHRDFWFKKFRWEVFSSTCRETLLLLRDQWTIFIFKKPQKHAVVSKCTTCDEGVHILGYSKAYIIIEKVSWYSRSVDILLIFQVSWYTMSFVLKCTWKKKFGGKVDPSLLNYSNRAYTLTKYSNWAVNLQFRLFGWEKKKLNDGVDAFRV